MERTAMALLLSTILIQVECGRRSLAEQVPGSLKPWAVAWIWSAISLILLAIAFRPGLWFTLAVAAIPLSYLLETAIYSLQKHLALLTGRRFQWMQIIPMACLSAFAFFMSSVVDVSPSFITVSVWAMISRLPVGIHASPVQAALYIAGYAFLTGPSNFIIRYMLDKDDDATCAVELRAFLARHPSAQARRRPSIQSETVISQEVLNAGKSIGVLERWIVATLVLLSQYGSMAVVLTAKSIARFPELGNDKRFAEYYLLGTLYSILMALLVGLAMQSVR